MIDGVGRRKKYLPVAFLRRQRQQKTRPSTANATEPTTTPMTMPSFLSLVSPWCALPFSVTSFVASAFTDVVGEPITPPVVTEWTLYVVPSIATAVGQVRDATCVSVVDG